MKIDVRLELLEGMAEYLVVQLDSAKDELERILTMLVRYEKFEQHTKAVKAAVKKVDSIDRQLQEIRFCINLATQPNDEPISDIEENNEYERLHEASE
jgi:CII-binding regulator of phage lambda lysogenization HflD